MELKDVRHTIEGKLDDIILNISKGAKNTVVYDKICEVLELIKASSHASFFNIDIVDISDHAELSESEEESIERKKLKAETLDTFLKEKADKDKVNIFFVFGACNVPSSPHSNILITVGDELYSVDSAPFSNSVPNILRGLGYNKVFANGIYYNDKKNRNSCTGLQVVSSTCVKKSLLTIINLLEIFKDFEISERKDLMQNFFKDGLVQYTGDRLITSSTGTYYKDSEEQRLNKKFFYNPLYSILESDLFDDLSGRLKKYLHEERKLIDASKDLEDVTSGVSKFSEFNLESENYVEAVDARLKKNYSTVLSGELEFAREVNRRLNSLADERLHDIEEEEIEPCSVADPFSGFATLPMDSVDLKDTGEKSSPKEAAAPAQSDFGKNTPKKSQESQGRFCW